MYELLREKAQLAYKLAKTKKRQEQQDKDADSR
jgi:hypothetical protein